jgi:hypothetical protein
LRAKIDTGSMAQSSASEARRANSTARRFKTGSVPGMPRQTGQTSLLEGAPKRVEQPQKIFESVRSWQWTSRPMTGSYSMPLPGFRAAR